MSLQQKDVSELVYGDILKENVYKNKTLLIKAGSKIDSKIISTLKKFNIKHVQVYSEEKDNKQNIRSLFFDSMRKVMAEIRYGRALNDSNKLTKLESLFQEFLADKIIYDVMFSLYEYDYESYLHSFDVFVLSTLMMEKDIDSKDFISFSLGCLLHDVGKLQVPKAILKKKGHLTTTEFEIMKKHTIWGCDWVLMHIKNNRFDKNMIIDLVKYHHERFDGSGYPEGLTKEDISEYVQALMVIDIYSALSLPRPYREPFSATRSLEQLFESDGKVNLLYVQKLCNMMGIYPVDTVVELSNGKQARVIFAKDYRPDLPVLQYCDTDETFELPLDFTIAIKRMLKRETVNRFENVYGRYVKALITGDKELALGILQTLMDGMRVEDIYMDIFARSMEEVGQLWVSNSITVAEEHVASMITSEIMDIKLHHFRQACRLIKRENNRIVFSTVGNEQHTLPLQMVADLFEINCWRTYNLVNPLPVQDLIKFIDKYHIGYVGFSVTMTENLTELQSIINVLKILRPKLVVLVGGQAIKEGQFPHTRFFHTAKEAVLAMNREINN